MRKTERGLLSGNAGWLARARHGLPHRSSMTPRRICRRAEDAGAVHTEGWVCVSPRRYAARKPILGLDRRAERDHAETTTST